DGCSISSADFVSSVSAVPCPWKVEEQQTKQILRADEVSRQRPITTLASRVREQRAVGTTPQARNRQRRKLPWTGSSLCRRLCSWLPARVCRALSAPSTCPRSSGRAQTNHLQWSFMRKAHKSTN